MLKHSHLRASETGYAPENLLSATLLGSAAALLLLRTSACKQLVSSFALRVSWSFGFVWLCVTRSGCGYVPSAEHVCQALVLELF